MRMPAHAAPPSFDAVLVGGGLANALIAWRLAQARPELRIAIIEAADAIGGDHTWSFHATDLTAAQSAWIAPLVAHDWPAQEVRFPAHTRCMRAGYRSLTTASVVAALSRLPGLTMLTGAAAHRLDADGVTLADGQRIAAPCVVDGRGHRPSPHLILGFQKFVGIEFEVPGGHGVAHPVLMDATVPQQDGYRFIYLLPFTPTRILVEDTRYSDGAALERAAMERAVREDAAARGWHDLREVRAEEGVLPIALAFDAREFWRGVDGAVPVGLRAGLFHPTTGYSLPLAVRIADLVAQTVPLNSAALGARMRREALRVARRHGFFRLLNRMLFRGCGPAERYRVLQRFYRLPEPLIERFYADRLTWRDRLRILVGRPPIPIHRGIACLDEQRVLRAARRLAPADA
jgi:lycopene beta-cyclase